MIRLTLVLLSGTMLASLPRCVAADEEREIRGSVFAALAQMDASARAIAEARRRWGAPEKGVPNVLDRVVETLAAADEEVEALVERCRAPYAGGPVPSLPSAAGPTLPGKLPGDLRLYYGRWLAQERLYDNAREQLADLKPAETNDPLALLFYQSIVFHRLLERERGLAAIDELLERATTDTVPARYLALARLMRHDLEALKPDNLDHIARRMEDVERRLALGQADKRVRVLEDGVIASLDKLIKQMEEQQQNSQQQQGASSQGRNNLPANAAQQSRIMEGKGQGVVAKRPIGNTSGWGNLPPKEREEALQQIGREFPPHYRDVVEQYFRKLAAEESRTGENK